MVRFAWVVIAIAALAIRTQAQSVRVGQGTADQNLPVFYFGGKQFYVGMPEREALAALSICCKLSPPVDSEAEKRQHRAAEMAGHSIISNDGPPYKLMGDIYFSEGSIAVISRPLADDVDTSSDDLVAFMKAFKRSLPEGEHSVLVSVRHEPMSNAEDDVVTFVFPNGRGIELHIGTLDKPKKNDMRRDYVTLDEFVRLPGQ